MNRKNKQKKYQHKKTEEEGFRIKQKRKKTKMKHPKKYFLEEEDTNYIND